MGRVPPPHTAPPSAVQWSGPYIDLYSTACTQARLDVDVVVPIHRPMSTEEVEDKATDIDAYIQPLELLDPDHITAYKAYKRNVTEET